MASYIVDLSMDEYSVPLSTYVRLFMRSQLDIVIKFRDTYLRLIAAMFYAFIDPSSMYIFGYTIFITVGAIYTGVNAIPFL